VRAEPETIINSAVGAGVSLRTARLSSTRVRELDHKLILDLYSIDDRRSPSGRRPEALPAAGIYPRRQAVVYVVREKGVDNLGSSLSTAHHRQLTHLASERIWQFRFSQDGSKIAMERGHSESDAVLLRDTMR
jgi:hypothetical protein